MPISAHQLHRYAVIPPHLRRVRLDKHNDQRYDPTQHVRSMQPRNDIKELSAARTLEGDPLIPDTPEPQPLQRDKSNPQCHRQRYQITIFQHFPALERLQGHLYRHTADQDRSRGIPESPRNREAGPGRLIPLHNIRARQSGKHHHNAAQRHPQREFMGMYFLSLLVHFYVCFYHSGNFI